ncbi:hypothetical protein PCO85_03095 [Prodigiosinella aquatilis]|nr:hypothetical protein [Prodigiosinella sp. LS101]WJV54464.1 hypothetical protein PCO85_03095 [Prodigiosinella sp. LS101]WJV58826.1 hypothetical protein PCO84_03105 [Pectobacteriaceae bacterium C111]
MDSLENAQLALSRVQFIAEIALIADCDKKDLQMALSMISHLAEQQYIESGQVENCSNVGQKS